MKNFSKVFTAVAAAAVIVSGASVTALAQTSGLDVNAGLSASTTVTTGGTGTGAGASIGGGANLRATVLQKRIDQAEQRADQEISRRLSALTALQTRVNSMTKISSSTQANLTSAIAAQITDLTNLQGQIALDASSSATSSLKADIQSITKSYRIFMLVIPQGAIEAAAGRVTDVAGLLSTLEGKLQTRVSDAQTGGANVSSSVAALADMNVKITDANVQAQAAVSEVSALQPDNGVQSVMQSNIATLHDARAKIVAAQHDLAAARQDAQTVIKALIQLQASANANADGNAGASSSASSSSE